MIINLKYAQKWTWLSFKSTSSLKRLITYVNIFTNDMNHNCCYLQLITNLIAKNYSYSNEFFVNTHQVRGRQLTAVPCSFACSGQCSCTCLGQRRVARSPVRVCHLWRADGCWLEVSPHLTTQNVLHQINLPLTYSFLNFFKILCLYF